MRVVWLGISVALPGCENAVMLGRHTRAFAARFALTLAIGAGGLLASGRILAGFAATIAAIAAVWSWIKSRDDDDRGVGPSSRARMG